MRTFDFDQQLAMSQTPDVEAGIRRALFEGIPGLLAIHKAHKKNDLRGVDYWLELPGRMQALDVKVRQHDFSLNGEADNVCLELVANDRTEKPGWVLDPDKITDWVLVYFKDSSRSYLYPFQLLQAAVLKQRAKWKAERKKTARQITKTLSGSYSSESLFVSNRDIWAGMYQLSNGKPQEACVGDGNRDAKA